MLQYTGTLQWRHLTVWPDGCQIESSIELISIVGQVTIGVLSDIDGMIHTRQGHLQVTQQRVGSGKARHVHTTPARTDHLRYMNRSRLRNRR